MALNSRFRLGFVKKFSTLTVMRHWNRLPIESVDALSLEALRLGWMGL